MDTKLLIPIDTLMRHYCDTACDLWNYCFLPMLSLTFDRPDFEMENEWDFRDRYYDTCVNLFCALVLWPLGIHESRPLPAYRADKDSIKSIIVIPKSNTEIRIGLPNENGFRGYDYTVDRETLDSLSLSFKDFFDFDELNRREYEWVHAVVVCSPRQTDLVGRNILVKRSDVNFKFSKP